MSKTIHLFLILIITFNVSCNSKRKLSSSTESQIEVVTPKRAEVLFLGHNSSHHDSQKYAPWLSIKLFKSGINLTYTNELSDLSIDNLAKYDGIIIYANHETISSEQEAALRVFVEGGKGLIALHSAAGCFKNSEWYKNAVG
jgi:type 1 glutamine amidotransferase